MLGEGLPELVVGAFVLVGVVAESGLTSAAVVFTGGCPAYFAAALSNGSEPAGGATTPLKVLRNDTMRP